MFKTRMEGVRVKRRVEVVEIEEGEECMHMQDCSNICVSKNFHSISPLQLLCYMSFLWLSSPVLASLNQQSLESVLDNLHEAVPELLTPQGSSLPPRLVLFFAHFACFSIYRLHRHIFTHSHIHTHAVATTGMLEFLVRAEELDSIPDYVARYAGPARVVLDNGERGYDHRGCGHS